jgi:putative resolvase
MDEYLKIGEASKKLGVSIETLRIWEKTGEIEVIRTSGKHRLFNIETYKNKQKIKEINNTGGSKKQEEGAKFIYCRVSSSKQKEDLERQVEYLSKKYKGYQVCKEIGSGINFKRKKLYSLLDQAFEGKISEIVVAHKDRLCRFAWDHFLWLFNKLGVTVVVDSESENTTTPNEQLADDLMSIIHVFSSKHYGLRSRKGTSKSSGDEIESDSDTGE